jgi:hypothetical protein
MADMAKIEQVKAETVAAEMAKLVAADVHWALQRLDFSNVVYDLSEPRRAETRYGLLLIKLARLALSQLESETP